MNTVLRPLKHATRLALCSTFLLGLVGGLLLGGCGDTDYRPKAQGPSGEVLVVVDSAKWEGAVGDTLRASLAPYVNTLPVPRRFLDLVPVNLTPAQIGRVQRHKNVVVVGNLSDSTNEAQFLRDQFSEEAQQEIRNGGTYISRPDLWRRDQRVFYVAAGTPQNLIQTIRQSGSIIRDSINTATRRDMRQEMFSEGRQPEIEKQLMNEHGFAVNVQHDYIVVKDTTVANTGFVLLARKISAESWRRLFVWYKVNGNPSTLSRDWILATRDSLAKIYYQGGKAGAAYIDRRRTLNTEQISFQGHYGYETRGLWYMAIPQAGGDSPGADSTLKPVGGGGPFLNYSFYHRGQDRLYMLDGMIFAPKPEYDEREFLRQMEVIAHTFRTAQDTSAQTVARSQQQ